MPTATRVDTLLGAVGITIIARWMARIKGAPRRSRGHYCTIAASGYVPLARQVEGGTSYNAGIFTFFHTRELPYLYGHVGKVLCRRFCYNAILQFHLGSYTLPHSTICT